jgi:hypothetical protein
MEYKESHIDEYKAIVSFLPQMKCTRTMPLYLCHFYLSLKYNYTSHTLLFVIYVTNCITCENMNSNDENSL